jgi:hypothetical protein
VSNSQRLNLLKSCSCSSRRALLIQEEVVHESCSAATHPKSSTPTYVVLSGHCWQVFGPYAAQVLASCCEQTMADCLQGLDKQLETLEGILWPVLDQVTQVLQRERTPKDDKDSKKDMRASCLPAVTAALGSMDPQAAVLNVSKTLGEWIEGGGWGGTPGRYRPAGSLGLPSKSCVCCLHAHSRALHRPATG